MYKPSLLPIATLCTLPLALTACPSQSGPNASSATWAKSQTPAEINLGPREAIEGNPLAELIKTTLAESGPEAALATAQANVVLESFPSCKQSGLLAFSIGEEQPRILLSDGNYTTNLSRLDPVCQHLGFEKATRANFVPLSNAKDGEVENSELLPLFAYRSVGQTQGGMPAQAPFHAGYCGPNPQGVDFYPYSAFTGLPEGSFSGTNRRKGPPRF